MCTADAMRLRAQVGRCITITAARPAAWLDPLSDLIRRFQPLFRSIALCAHKFIVRVDAQLFSGHSSQLLFKLLIKNVGSSRLILTLAINIFDCCLTNFLCFFRRTA